jgi:hypothetical protein
LQGVKIEGRVYAGGWWDWLSPFSLLTGVSLVCGYALLGSGWLILKSDGRLQQRAYRFARPLAFGLLAAIIGVSTATPFLDGNCYRRWFAWPGVLAAVQMPLLVQRLPCCADSPPRPVREYSTGPSSSPIDTAKGVLDSGAKRNGVKRSGFAHLFRARQARPGSVS